MGDLPARVHAGVGAPGAGDPDRGRAAAPVASASSSTPGRCAGRAGGPSRRSRCRRRPRSRRSRTSPPSPARGVGGLVTASVGGSVRTRPSSASLGRVLGARRRSASARRRRLRLRPLLRVVGRLGSSSGRLVDGGVRASAGRPPRQPRRRPRPASVRGRPRAAASAASAAGAPPLLRRRDVGRRPSTAAATLAAAFLARCGAGRRLGLADRLGLGRQRLDQLDDRHRRVVALARADLGDAGVAAGAVRRSAGRSR